MRDDRIEQLLRGYVLPEVSPELDHRVFRDGAAIMEGARTHVTVESVSRSVLDHIGFGCLAWVVDFVTTADAEYRVDFI